MTEVVSWFILAAEFYENILYYVLQVLGVKWNIHAIGLSILFTGGFSPPQMPFRFIPLQNSSYFISQFLADTRQSFRNIFMDSGF
jgi:hypothetical protein